MKALIAVFVVSLFLAAKCISAPSAESIGAEIRQGDLPALAVKTDKALSHLIHFSARQLERRGYQEDADQITTEYEALFDGFLTRMVIQDIGDHKPLSAWLAQVTKILEDDLGFETCKLLHITDIDVFNYGIPVVFHPCDFPMDAVTVTREVEYSYHFADSPKYGPALLPVVSYWVAEIVCTAATYGTGAFLMCSPIAWAVEEGMDHFIAPPLSNFIWERKCQ